MIALTEKTSDFTIPEVPIGNPGFLIDTSAGAVTVTFPSAAKYIGLPITLTKSAQNNSINLISQGSETFDGQIVLAGNNQYAALTLMSDGSNWVSLIKQDAWDPPD